MFVSATMVWSAGLATPANGLDVKLRDLSEGYSRPAPSALATNDEVRVFIVKSLNQQQVSAVMASRTAVGRIAELIAFIRTPAGEGMSIEIDVRPVSRPNDTHVLVSLVGKFTLEDLTRDMARPRVQTFRIPEFSLHITPFVQHARPKVAVPETIVEKPDVVSGMIADQVSVCGPNDSSCWIDSAVVADTDLVCGEVIRELGAHLTAMQGLGDPNTTPGLTKNDLSKGQKDLSEHMSLVGRQRPCGRLGDDQHPRFDSFEPAVPCLAGEPSETCMAEFNTNLDRTIPTLECTKAVIEWQRWSRDDPVVSAAQFPLTSWVGNLPIVSNYLAFKGRVAADNFSWKGVWAVRWLDRVGRWYRQGDIAFVKKAIASVGGVPGERKVLAYHLRLWFGSKAFEDLNQLFTLIYQEHFLDLYPEAASRDGLPDVGAFPTRLWWASNWLAAIRDRGIDPVTAVKMLDCSPDGPAGRRILAELAPYLQQMPRLTDTMVAIEALL